MKLPATATVVLLLITTTSTLASLFFNDGGDHVIDYRITDAVWVDLQAPQMRTHIELAAGGWLNHGTSIVLKNKSRFTMTGGMMDWSIWAESDSEVNITGGYVEGYLNTSSRVPALVSGGSMNGIAIQQSNLVFSEGVIREHISLVYESTATITGGSIGAGNNTLGASVRLYNDGELTISGGEIVNGVSATDTALITLVGSNFTINGVSVSHGAKASSFAASGTITGVLENGDLFNNSYELKGASDIQVIPEPSTAILLSGTGILFFCIRRKFHR